MALTVLEQLQKQDSNNFSGLLNDVPLCIQLVYAVGAKDTFQRSYQDGGKTFVVSFSNGEVTGFRGPVLEGHSDHTLEEGIGILMGKGVGYEEALQELKQQLIRNLLQLSARGTFSPDNSDLGRVLPLQMKLGELLSKQIKSNQNEDLMLRSYGLALHTSLQWSALPCQVVDLGLPLQMLKDYRKMSGAMTVGAALDIENRVTDVWRSLDVFVKMGLVSLKDAQSAAATVDETVNVERVKVLEATLQRFTSEPAYKIFGLTTPTEVNDKHIDQIFRELSKEYHPDRHMNVSSIEKEIIVDIFAQLNELYGQLQDEEQRAELKKRLDVERRGEQYVSDEDAKKSEVLQAQGTFFFRKRKYTEALEVLDKAFEINPYNWRTNTMRIRCQAELGTITKKQAAEVLADNKDARGADRVELLFQAGLYFHKDGVEERAYELFAKVVELDESHIDAKRYLHLRKNKAKSETKDESQAEAEEKAHSFLVCLVENKPMERQKN